jgi:hypothetical protein
MLWRREKEIAFLALSRNRSHRRQKEQRARQKQESPLERRDFCCAAENAVGNFTDLPDVAVGTFPSLQRRFRKAERRNTLKSNGKFPQLMMA